MKIQSVSIMHTLFKCARFYKTFQNIAYDKASYEYKGLNVHINMHIFRGAATKKGSFNRSVMIIPKHKIKIHF